MEEASKDDTQLVLLNLDISLPDHLEKIVTTATQADVIIFNLEDGRLIKTILKRLVQEKRKHDVILAILKIHTWSISETWNTLTCPRIDISSFGHPDGFGISLLTHCGTKEPLFIG